MAWRLGLDLGANSLGWAALELDDTRAPCRIIAAGTRIFSDGREPARGDMPGASLAESRREKRAARRRRDRFKRRQAALLKYLVKDGLFPEDAEQRRALAVLDPYELRARALDHPLTLPELGRALFHLNQRRGFQSNRKADRGKDDESGKIAIGIDRLRSKLDEAGARTFGEFLHLRRRSAADANAIPSVRTRLRPETGDGTKGDGYDFYPGRDLLKAEFDRIWEIQAPHHPTVLTKEAYKRLHEIIFHQRPLRVPEVGKCTLLPEERRIPKAHPLFQRRRLLEELNALMIVQPGEAPQRLTREQRDLLFLKLKDKRKVSFESLRKTLKLGAGARFNKESEHRTHLTGDEVAAEMGAKTRFGVRWAGLPTDEQWDVVQRHTSLESDADEAAFRAWLTERYGLTAEQAAAVAGARLPSGYGRFGLTATSRLIESLTNDTDDNGKVLVYSEAVDHAGLRHHSDFRTGEVHLNSDGRPTLPYYGTVLERHIMPGTADPSDPDEMRIGRFTNPTVHIGLNQLRRVVNRLIRAYGMPDEIVLELARELKLSDEEKQRRNRENSLNRKKAEDHARKLQDLGLPNTGANRARLKLWEELNAQNALDRRCIYSGAQISIQLLFTDAVEVDHILPFAATLDDSPANKIVCLREANREKRKRAPFAAWGHTPRWPEIAERAARLPSNKRWRFEPDAMERFRGESAFLARHLVDTQYLSRLAREYLASLFPERGEGSSRVWVSPGRLTEIVRRKLGLNELLPDHNLVNSDQAKNRLDHRHHAIDAAIVGVIDRSFLRAAQEISGRYGEEGRQKIEFPEPWPSFRNELREAVNNIVVSHRVDHGTISKAKLKPSRNQTAGRLHNDTAYGLTGDVDEKGNSLVVHRVPLSSLKKASDIAKVRDPLLRAALDQFMQGVTGKNFETRIARFPELAPLPYRGIRRVRIIEPLSVIPIQDATGRAYKGYKGDSNYCYSVWEMPDGKWRSDVISMFDAHQSGTVRRPHPAARKVLGLHRNDVLAVERTPSVRELLRVVKFSEGSLVLAALNESGNLKARDADKQDYFKYVYSSPSSLKNWRARQVRIDEIGRVLDPGFPARRVAGPHQTQRLVAE